MFNRILQVLFIIAAAFVLTVPAQAQSTTHIYELRTYTAHEGRLNDVLNRFRDHTARIFARHGMVSIGDVNAFHTDNQEAHIHFLNDYVFGRS